MGILDWPLKDSRQPQFGKKIRRDFSLKIGMNLRRVRAAVASHNEFGTCKLRRYGSSASGHRREATIGSLGAP